MKMPNQGAALLILIVSGALGCGNGSLDDNGANADGDQGGATPSLGGNGGATSSLAGNGGATPSLGGNGGANVVTRCGSGGGSGGGPVAGSGAAAPALIGAGGGGCAPLVDVGATPAPRPDDVVFLPGVTVETLAGGSSAGTQDGPLASAFFSNPVSVLVDATGAVLVSDFDDNRIRQIDMASGEVSTLTSQHGFSCPFGLAQAPDGAIYADTDYDPSNVKTSATGTIWRIDPLTGAATVVAADLGRPRGLAALADGRLALADYQNARVRLLDPAAGWRRISPGALAAAGSRTAGERRPGSSCPYGIVALPGGDLVVTDYGNNSLRRVTLQGDVSPFAGDGGSGTIDGALSTARFAGPVALAIDLAGNIYVSDRDSHRIRRVGADGSVTTLAGDGGQGFRDGTGATAEFYGQEGIAVSPDGHSLYVADGSLGGVASFHRIRLLRRRACTDALLEVVHAQLLPEALARDAQHLGRLDPLSAGGRQGPTKVDLLELTNRGGQAAPPASTPPRSRDPRRPAGGRRPAPPRR